MFKALLLEEKDGKVAGRDWLAGEISAAER